MNGCGMERGKQNCLIYGDLLLLLFRVSRKENERDKSSCVPNKLGLSLVYENTARKRNR